jgi:polyphosphate kinase
MLNLGRDEDLEDTISHLSIYLTGLDRLYRETSGQLKHQIRRAAKAEKELKLERKKALQAISSLVAQQAKWQTYAEEIDRIEADRRKKGLMEGEPEMTHCDASTQTEDEVPESQLPRKKRRLVLSYVP